MAEKKKNHKPTAKSIKNLIPLNERTKEKQREIARLGGIRSGEAKRRNKTITQMTADFLVNTHKVRVKGNKLTDMTAEEIIIESIIGNLRAHGTSASVQTLDKIREYTEGVGGQGADGAKKDADLLSALMGDSSPNEDKTQGQKNEN